MATRAVLFDSSTALLATPPVTLRAVLAVWVPPVSGADALPTMEAALEVAEPTMPLASGSDTLPADTGAASAGAAVPNVRRPAVAARVASFFLISCLLLFLAWLAAKFRFTAVLLALRLAGPDLRFSVHALQLAELDQRFPGLDLRLAGLDLTSTLLGSREAPDEPPHVVRLSMNLPSYAGGFFVARILGPNLVLKARLPL